jgi:hypothetical protein
VILFSAMAVVRTSSTVVTVVYIRSMIADMLSSCGLWT